jgi:P27 family predicted phage terminase small subunit
MSNSKNKSGKSPVHPPALRAIPPGPPPDDSPPPPVHLSPATQQWWRKVLRDYQLEPHHLELLTLCCEARDRAEEARKILAAEGVTFRDDRGNVRAHPANAIERDARLAVARLLRELDLDFTEAPAGRRGRPPALPSNRRLSSW